MCQDCRIRGLERKKEQFEEPREGKPLHQRPSYPSKSRKVWLDRFHARRADLKRDIEWYQRGRDQGIKRDDWAAKRYREARAQAKKHGAL